MEKLYLVIIMLFLFGCKGKEEQSKSTILNIDNITEQSYASITDQATNVNIIPLETNKSSLIGDITRIINKNDKIYIYDALQQAILIFNNKGIFLNKIYRRGRSRAEYIRLKSFDVNEFGELVLLDNVASKLLIFSSDGDFIKHINLKLRSDYSAVSFLSDTTFCLFTRGSYHDGVAFTFDNQGNLIKKALSLSEDYNRLTDRDMFNVVRYRNSSNDLCIKLPFDNRIFVKSKDTFTCHTDIKFAGYDDTDKMFNCTERDDPFKYVRSNTNIMLTGVEFIEKKDYILSDILHRDWTVKHLLYNKKTGETILYKQEHSKLHTLMLGDLTFHNGDNNTLITEVSSLNVYRGRDAKLPENISENIKTIVAKLKKIAIKPDANPILVFFELNI